ncbi:MAG: NupC/NupG family nucleoside CNT transporter, partial [Shewanella sp.]
MNILMSLVGVVTLLAIGYLLSNNRKAISIRTVGGALAIQAAFGGFVLYVPFGKDVLQTLSNGVSSVIGYAQNGIGFLFGDLANFKVGFIFAVNVLPIIVFFSSLIAVLYYLGIMQWVIRIIGGALQKALGTSRTESMSATANIFVGQTEAPLVIRPFIPTMTQSELFAVMVGGLASIAGSVMAGYAQMGVPIEYLVAASFMAAPGGLLMAKLMHPQTAETINEMDELPEDPDKPTNVLDAAAAGAASGMHLALNVGAMLLAFVGLIAMLNGMLGGVGSWFGMPQLTLELILGYVFMPLAFLIGVPWHEAMVAGSFIGQKIVINEFVAYLNFAPYLKDVAEGG